MNTNRKNSGFTLLELMLAVVIFGFLMMVVSSFLRTEIHTFNIAVTQDEVDEKARTAMMQVLDVIRLHSYSFYDDPTQQVYYVYYNPNDSNAPGVPMNLIDSRKNQNINDVDTNAIIYCLIDPKSTVSSPVYDLWYRDKTQNGTNTYLISDDIVNFSITPYFDKNNVEDIHLIKINLEVMNLQTTQSCDLKTYKRLY